MLRKKLWIILLVSSSCFTPKESTQINYSDISDFNQTLYKKTKMSPKLITTAKMNYKRLCQSCHGYLAEGRVGPNLTDKYWIHGQGKITDIYKVIRYGATSKGMRSYQKTLSDQEIMAMSLFIQSLKGSSPKGSKEPQGKLIN